MKISRIICAFLLLCFFGIGFAYSQGDAKNDKSAASRVEVKVNLMALEADGKYADIKLEDLKIFEDGAEQKITYFAKKENVLNAGLVMDNTGSIRTQFAAIEAASATFAANLRPQDEAFVVRFVSSDKVEMIENWTADKTALKEALTYMYVEGGRSAIIDALYVSAEKILEREKAERSKRYAIILFSDGEDRDSYYEPKELFDLLKPSNAQIFIIGLTQNLSDKKNAVGKKNSKTNAENLIKSLALKTGGAAFFVEGKSKNDFEAALVAALKGVLTEVNSQYIIGYTPINQKRDGLPRKLTVQIADGAKSEKRQAFIRDGFIVPEEKKK